MQRYKFVLAAVLAATALLFAPGTSKADFTIGLSDGSGDAVTVDYNTTSNSFSLTGAIGNLANLINTTSVSAGYNSLGTNGATANQFSIGSTLSVDSFNGTTTYSINGLTFEGYHIALQSVSTNEPGTAGGATLNFANTTVQTNGTGHNPLTITATQAGYNLPVGPVILTGQLSSSFSNESGASVSGYITDSDLGTNVDLGTATQAGGSPGSVSSGVFTSSGSFSLTNTLTINGLTSLGEVDASDQSDLQATPAPSGLILAATMVPFVGLLRRRLWQTVVVAA